MHQSLSVGVGASASGRAIEKESSITCTMLLKK
jgi:hypothetical protein